MKNVELMRRPHQSEGKKMEKDALKLTCNECLEQYEHHSGSLTYQQRRYADPNRSVFKADMAARIEEWERNG